MTDREKEIFNLIQENPLISQNDIAIKLNITRTSVAVHISNLIKKGFIAGKGYITNIKHPITVIGGANVDVQGSPYHKLIMYDSNPGTIQSSLGGVGRNIAENMSLLGLDVRLITAIGNDQEGGMILSNASMRSINIEDGLVSQQHRTSTYLYIQNEEGEMIAAVSDMAIVDQLNPAFLKRKLMKIDHSPYTVMDGNLSEETIAYLATQLKSTRLVLDPVSTTKALRAKPVLDRFYGVKLNRMEAEVLCEKPLTSSEDLVAAGKYFLGLGVQKVLITLGSEGVYYCDQNVHFIREALPCSVVNVTGAGDAFTAAMVRGFMDGLSPDALVDYCMAASVMALQSPKTISEALSHQQILSIIKEYKR